MVDLSGAISQMAVLLLVTFAGYIAGKLGYIDAEMRDRLTRILLNITLPCMIVASVGELDAQSAHGLIPIAFGLAVTQYFLLLACGALCNFMLRVPKEQRSLYLFMSTCVNNGFIGLPTIAAIYGNQTVLFSSIFITVLAFFTYSVGFAILAGPAEGESDAAVGTKKRLIAAMRGIPWKSVVNPAMVASILAIVLLLAGVHVPHVLNDAMDMLGSVTAPVAMMIVGALLSSVRFRTVVTEVRLYPFVVFRQLLAPLALLYALRALGIDETIVIVYVIMFSMPVGSMTSTFASQFGRDPLLPAKGTIVSTIASFAIIPILVIAMAVS